MIYDHLEFPGSKLFVILVSLTKLIMTYLPPVFSVVLSFVAPLHAQMFQASKVTEIKNTLSTGF